MSGLLLDTDAFLEFCEAKINPNSPVNSFLAAQAVPLFICEISLGEAYSALEGIPPEKDAAKREYLRTLDRITSQVFGDGRTIPFTGKNIQAWARIRYIAEATNSDLAPERAQVLAVAENYGFTCITKSDPLHAAVGAKTFDPWASNASKAANA